MSLFGLPDWAEKHIAPEPNSGCWLWMGLLFEGSGYARTGVGARTGATQLVHRRVYELLRGPIPGALPLDHKCRVRCCVNPAHLEPVTPKENLLRGEGACAKNARKSACKNGHVFTPENTYARSDGARGCRACNAARQQTAAGKAYHKRYRRSYYLRTGT